MSDWQIHLEFEEGSSSKFWRARIEGGTLYVNFGKIGTNGQTQVKDLGSPEAAKKELDKLEREKRKKGYVDAGGGGGGGGGGEEEDEEDEDEEEDEKPKKAAAPAAPAAAAGATRTFLLVAHGRKVETKLVLAGKQVRMEAVETYGSPDAAREALGRLAAALIADGHMEE